MNINLTLVSAEGIQIPVLRQALNVGGNFLANVNLSAEQIRKVNQFCKADFRHAVFIVVNLADKLLPGKNSIAGGLFIFQLVDCKPQTKKVRLFRKADCPWTCKPQFKFDQSNISIY